MNKAEIKELYNVMFSEYPDIIDMNQLQKMLGIGRKLAYKLVGDGYICVLLRNGVRTPQAHSRRFTEENY